MKKTKLMLTSLLSLLLLTGCHHETENSTSVSTPEEKPSEQTKTEPFTGTANLTGLSAEEKTALLGQREGYAQKNHLTGIPLYGSGGYTLISERIALPVTNNVANYGFGTLREGYIKTNRTDEQEPVKAYQGYYHTALASTTNNLSSLDASDNSTGALVGYITSSLFSKRLVKKNDANKTYEEKYEWYGSLAKEDAPEGVDDDYATTHSSKKWRIKVKTGANSGLKFKTLSTKSIDGITISSFNDTPVTVDDYIFALKVRMTQKYGNYYAFQYASDASEMVGAADYLDATAENGRTSDKAKAAWNNVGYKKIDDETIEVEFVHPTDQFGARYRLSDTLLSPINEKFYTLVTTLKANGKIDEGDFTNDNYAKSISTTYTPADTTLSLGAYIVKEYEIGTGTDNRLVFVKNEDWVDTVNEKKETGYDIYRIPGIVVNVNSAMNQDPTANYKNFKAGKTDVSSIPSSVKDTEAGDKPYKHYVPGDSVWKLQVNSLTQEEWNSIFKKGGEVIEDYQTEDEKDYYQCKPIRSNDDFINGVYTCINREALAGLVSADIGDSFFSDLYEIDPINHVPYNSTEAHKKARKNYYPSTHGYNLEASKQLFSRAIDSELTAGHYKAGTKDNPTVIQVQVAYQTQSQIEQEGTAVEKYIEDAFNAVGLDKGVKLDVVNYAPAVWSDIYYNRTLVGKFDFAFASISGGTLDPIGFRNTLCSNSRTTFTLSWGAHTNVDTGEIVYNGKSYSFDARYEALALGDAEIKDGALVY